MANREQRSSREKRKPKAEKPKLAAKASPFSSTPATGNVKGGAGKKGR
jgi:hypothetical protein